MEMGRGARDMREEKRIDVLMLVLVLEIRSVKVLRVTTMMCRSRVLYFADS